MAPTTLARRFFARPERPFAEHAHRFVATAPWSAERPEALVICCSDGRWHGQIEEFIRAQVTDRADLMALPGGPAIFNRWTSSPEEARIAQQALAFLSKHHTLSSAWLIAHQECAYYAAKYGPLDSAYQFRRQREDLDRAADVLRHIQANLAIHQVFALREGERVVFTCD